MIMSKRAKFLVVAAVLCTLSIATAETISGSAGFGFVSTAEARVGRPLTPVSVAGVARRTARRCAAGVYNC